MSRANAKACVARVSCTIRSVESCRVVFFQKRLKKSMIGQLSFLNRVVDWSNTNYVFYESTNVSSRIYANNSRIITNVATGI